RMNLALALVVAGLARSALSVSPTLPDSHTLMWMWLRNSTPPGTSEWLLLPVRRRLRVTSLLPNAARNANGNSAASKGWSASSEMACSISTAIMRRLAWQASWFPCLAGAHAPQHFLYFLPLPHGHGALRSGVASARIGSRGVRA